VKRLQFNEETFRDGQQSLWANRMKTGPMLDAAPMLDEAGFDSINIMSGSAFESCVLYLNEDPWERLHLLGRLLPKTDIQVLIRGRSAFGWRRFPDDAIELLIRCLQNTGVKGIVVFDGLNDISNIAWHIRVAKKIGLQIHPALVFTESPVHTDDYYAAKARECVKLGVDSVNLADASGLLSPERVRTLIPAIRKVVGDKAFFSFVSHDGTGLAVQNYIEALSVGVDNLSTTSLPLSYGNSIPSTLDVVSLAREAGYDVDIDTGLQKRIDDYFYRVAYEEGQPVGRRVQFDPVKFKNYTRHQIPGGMMSHLVSQLKNLGLDHHLSAVLEEAGRVRQEIGYPVMVTPFSQIVGVQAVFNVIEGERYKTVPSDLCLYARGYYGTPASPIDPDVMDRILEGEEKEPIDPAAHYTEPLVEEVRRQAGARRSDEELLLELFFSRPTIERFHRDRKPIEFPAATTPLSVLIRELSKRANVGRVRIQKGGVSLEQVF